MKSPTRSHPFGGSLMLAVFVTGAWCLLQVGGKPITCPRPFESIVFDEWCYGWPCNFARRPRVAMPTEATVCVYEDWSDIAYTVAFPVSDGAESSYAPPDASGSTSILSEAWLFQSEELADFSFPALLVDLLIGMITIGGVFVASRSRTKSWRWRYSFRSLLAAVTAVSIFVATVPVMSWGEVFEVASLLIMISAMSCVVASIPQVTTWLRLILRGRSPNPLPGEEKGVRSIY